MGLLLFLDFKFLNLLKKLTDNTSISTVLFHVLGEIHSKFPPYVNKRLIIDKLYHAKTTPYLENGEMPFIIDFYILINFFFRLSP